MDIRSLPAYQRNYQEFLYLRDHASSQEEYDFYEARLTDMEQIAHEAEVYAMNASEMRYKCLAFDGDEMGYPADDFDDDDDEGDDDQAPA